MTSTNNSVWKSVRRPVYNSIRNVKPCVNQKLEEYDFDIIRNPL
jgi:hypothetical protein